jgi:signal recognition particle subunit SRP54
MDDLLKQLRTIQKMGPLSEVLGKLPMFGSLAEQVDERELGKVEAIIHSMTRAERSRPELIDKSRAARIARGSGRRSKEVTDLVTRFSQMREMMGSLGGGGLRSKLPGIGRLAGGGAAGLGALDPSALRRRRRGNRRHAAQVEPQVAEGGAQVPPRAPKIALEGWPAASIRVQSHTPKARPICASSRAPSTRFSVDVPMEKPSAHIPAC